MLHNLEKECLHIRMCVVSLAVPQRRNSPTLPSAGPLTCHTETSLELHVQSLPVVLFGLRSAKVTPPCPSAMGSLETNPKSGKAQGAQRIHEEFPERFAMKIFKIPFLYI